MGSTSLAPLCGPSPVISFLLLPTDSAIEPFFVDASVISRKTADLKFWSDFGAK
jgi:hypothetical protein